MPKLSGLKKAIDKAVKIKRGQLDNPGVAPIAGATVGGTLLLQSDDVNGGPKTEVLKKVANVAKNTIIPFSAATATGMLGRPDEVSAEQRLILNGLDNPDTITADEFPRLQQVGTFIGDIDTPFGRPLQGLGEFLQTLGEPQTLEQRITRAINASPI